MRQGLVEAKSKWQRREGGRTLPPGNFVRRSFSVQPFVPVLLLLAMAAAVYDEQDENNHDGGQQHDDDWPVLPDLPKKG